MLWMEFGCRGHKIKGEEMQFKKYKLDLVQLDYLKRIYREVTGSHWDVSKITLKRSKWFIDIVTKTDDEITVVSIYDEGEILFSGDNDKAHAKAIINAKGILNESQWMDPREEKPKGGGDIKIYVWFEGNILRGTYAHTMFWYYFLNSSWPISPHNKELTGWVYADSVKSIT